MEKFLSEVNQSEQNSKQIPKLFKQTENLEQKLIRNALDSGGNLVLEKPENQDLVFVEFRTSKDLYNFLERLSNSGFLFHGSTRIIETLQPNQANCTEKLEGNNKAVYFCQNSDVALFKALTGGLDGFSPYSVCSEFDENNETEDSQTYFRFSGEPAQVGYIYVAKNSQNPSKNLIKQVKDDNGNEMDEFMSENPITPVMRIKVRLEQFDRQIEKVDLE
jgi:hypothetical protein